MRRPSATPTRHRRARDRTRRGRLAAGVAITPVVTIVVVVLVAAVAFATRSGPWRPARVTAHASATARAAARPDPTGTARTPGPSPGASRPAPGSPADRADPVGVCATGLVSAMTLPERVGQLLMVGAPVTDPASLAGTVRRYRLGGVFLAGRDRGPATVLREQITALQAAAPVPLQIAVDQEGGAVQTLQGADFPPIPAAVTQGGWDPTTLARRTTDWARRLAAVGVTLDLAPVAGTVPAGTAAANPPIGAFGRQYGSTPDQVAAAVATVVTAVQGSGVLATVKHFPGLGRVRANTDTSADAVDATMTVDSPDLRPFAAGIGAGAAAVMISSARYPRLDPDSIAAFSEPIVTGLLRQRMGFTGLILSDDLGAAVAVAGVPVGQRAVRFIRAGGDVVLTVRAGDAGPMSAALIAAAQASPAFDRRVTDAAVRVVRDKYRAGLLRCALGP